MLKTWPRQLLRSLPIDIAFPGQWILTQVFWGNFKGAEQSATKIVAMIIVNLATLKAATELHLCFNNVEFCLSTFQLFYPIL